MANNDRAEEQRNNLINQDAGISQTQFEEFRMNLDQSLNAVEQRVQASRLATIRSVMAVVVCYLFGLVLQMTQQYTPFKEIVLPLWALATNAALITAGVLVTRYWYKHRPALERERTDLQIAMFSELQRQLNQLNERLDQQAKA